MTSTVNSNDIKAARPDIIILDDSANVTEQLVDLLFEDIGGQEIINIARNDLINGQEVLYQPIKNLSNLALQYNSQNIISIQNSSDVVFKNYSIKFEKCVPEIGNGANGAPVYLDTDGNLIIDVINVDTDEKIEVEIFKSVTVVNGTIY